MKGVTFGVRSVGEVTERLGLGVARVWRRRSAERGRVGFRRGAERGKSGVQDSCGTEWAGFREAKGEWGPKPVWKSKGLGKAKGEWGLGRYGKARA